MRQQQILDFWFPEAVWTPTAFERRMRVWFSNDAASQAAFDESIRREFGDDVESALRGELEGWAATSRGRLALILLLDQFPRNLFRGTARAFSGDAKALKLVTEGRKVKADLALSAVERLFFYMPLEHAEDLGAQAQSVEALRQLAADAPPETRELFGSVLPYAELHRDIIVRFGRFPHRNAALGRASTAQEREYLAGDAPAFGQSV